MERPRTGSRWLLSAAFIILAAVLSMAVLTAHTGRTAPLSVTSGTMVIPTSAAAAPAAHGYRLAVVATHDSASSCWTAINGKVYDVTKWISQHPGGSGPILSLCGTDGSAAFNAQHGGQARPAHELASFLIGDLAS